MGLCTVNSWRSEKLNLDVPWSIGEVAFERIVELIHRTQRPKRIVEFGSGPSSLRLAMAFPEASVLSIEGDRRCFNKTNALMEEFIRDSNLIVRYRGLKFQWYGSGQILSHEEDFFFGADDVDGVIVDGPPFYTLRGREACLYQIYTKLRIGGIVILDDYGRGQERIIVNNWLSVYPESFSALRVPEWVILA